MHFSRLGFLCNVGLLQNNMLNQNEQLFLPSLNLNSEEDWSSFLLSFYKHFSVEKLDFVLSFL